MEYNCQFIVEAASGQVKIVKWGEAREHTERKLNSKTRVSYILYLTNV